jgi:choline dehydrogenase-like flavoprotein
VAGGEVHLQPATYVVVAANPIETPRLLLNSASKTHPNGLANSSDQLGRNLTTHPGAGAWGMFEHDMNPWEGFLINHISCLDYAQTRQEHDFVRGFVMESMTALPVNLVSVIAAGLWGADLKRWMRSYARLGGLFTCCEGLPVASNRVTLDHSSLDRFGLPRGRIHYDWHANDLRLIEQAGATSERVLRAAGAVEVFRQPPSQLHMSGTARMGRDPATSVTDAFGRSHDVPNLFVAGGSLFPTASSVNPTLTILALAWRTAQHIAAASQPVSAPLC